MIEFEEFPKSRELLFSYNQVLELSGLITGNNLYRTTRNGIIYKDPRAKTFQEEIEWLLDPLSDEIRSKVHCYEIELVFISNWFFKNGKIRKIDLTNMMKIVEDAIAKRLEVDDSLCVRSDIRKGIPKNKMENDSLNIILKINFYGKFE